MTHLRTLLLCDFSSSVKQEAVCNVSTEEYKESSIFSVFSPSFVRFFLLLFLVSLCRTHNVPEVLLWWTLSEEHPLTSVAVVERRHMPRQSNLEEVRAGLKMKIL